MSVLLNEQDKWSCLLYPCSKKFNSRSERENHMEKHHCFHCSRYFKSRVELAIHMDSHKKCTEIWNCNYCLITMHSFSKWSEHIREVHMVKLKCDKCDIKFNLLTDVVKHMWQKHLENIYVCEACERMYQTKHRFSQHKCLKPPENYDGLQKDKHNRIYLPYRYKNGYFITKRTYFKRK